MEQQMNDGGPEHLTSIPQVVGAVSELNDDFEVYPRL